jgi:WD40 repeat protein
MGILSRGKTENRLHLSWQHELPDSPVALAWSPDGKNLAAACASGPVQVHGPDGRAISQWAGHGFGTTCLAWDQRGQWLASGGQDGLIRLTDTHLWQERVQLPGGAAWVERLVQQPGQGLLASTAGKRLRLWNVAGELQHEYAEHPGTIADLQWTIDGKQLAVAAYGGIWVYLPGTPQAAKQYTFRGAPLVVAWSPNGSMLAHGNQDSTVHFWYAGTTDELQMSGYPTKVTTLSWDSSSRYLATGGGAKVCIWDCGGSGPRGSKPIMLELHTAPLGQVAWQRRGFLLASAGRDGQLGLWQPLARKSQQVGRAQHAGEAVSLAWSPDDTRVAVGFDSGMLAVYRVG